MKVFKDGGVGALTEQGDCPRDGMFNDHRHAFTDSVKGQDVKKSDVHFSISCQHRPQISINNLDSGSRDNSVTIMAGGCWNHVITAARNALFIRTSNVNVTGSA